MDSEYVEDWRETAISRYEILRTDSAAERSKTRSLTEQMNAAIRDRREAFNALQDAERADNGTEKAQEHTLATAAALDRAQAKVDRLKAAYAKSCEVRKAADNAWSAGKLLAAFGVIEEWEIGLD